MTSMKDFRGSYNKRDDASSMIRSGECLFDDMQDRDAVEIIWTAGLLEEEGV